MDTLRIYTDFDLLVHVRESRRRLGLSVLNYEEEIQSGLQNKEIRELEGNKRFRIKLVKRCWRFGLYIKLVIENYTETKEVFFMNESSIDEDIILKTNQDLEKYQIRD